MHSLARFLRSSLRYVVCFFVLVLSAGLYCSIFASPADYRQGEVVRIMYLHVPSAWISLGSYTAIALLSLGTLLKKGDIFPMIARAIAPVGACFTAVCLVAGCIWGKYTWGTWWVWDARLTSVLLLFFLFLGYASLWNVFEDQNRAAKTTSLFALFSAVNVPIVKFSVDIWATLHQTSSILRKGGIAIDSSMLIPLLTMFVALSLLFVILTSLRFYTLLNNRQTSSSLYPFYHETT
ncbi:Heme exporter protein C [Anaplasma phagocytophilum]|uniref:Heme exporter protein C n=2 Tax=Anaplasma phagocytophilum TaxID=948 RepID=A0AA45UUA7_ANAPH|nr:heme ABC transporter permease CcmC [Anaplasma phagocytophilum]SBO14931.1 Heme exporter protein C [Anaplasma phagocytophilum]SBO33152.1 Heme exporter protein C [Anaplasma phagocytophilum]SBO33586.1 Heme exporter protein C [Anaplasma phagocytophilum]SBO33708.1 Heme exporter protein C [Anaplasma phagocytophilum]SCV63733.1 Heme exporter protein C [Anaplasma phagocytophilum]